MALGFVFVPAAATWTFGQALSMLRFCGLALIVLGITSHALTE
jgi:multidrug transporter EmrE-like cation transporter